MEFETIQFSVDAGIARITLARPDAGNAVTVELARELMHAATVCSEDQAVRAIVLNGLGRNFCVGGDLRAFSTRSDLPLHLKEVTTYLHAAVARLAGADAPVVASVQGSAAGAGMSLACSCDLVVASDTARFVMAYTRVGLSPDGSGSWFLPRLVGLGRALDLTLTNRVLTATDAAALGLVTRVVPDEQLVAATDELAAELASGPTRAFGAAKRLLRGSFTVGLETHLERETLALAANAGTGDGQEGIAAFLEKRPPRFTGR